MKIPVYNKIMTKNIIIRFSKNMALMLESGMLVTEILELMQESFDNIFVKAGIEDMRYSIISGGGIADHLSNWKYIQADIKRWW